jgi:hypothetical protein
LPIAKLGVATLPPDVGPDGTAPGQHIALNLWNLNLLLSTALLCQSLSHGSIDR